jgi:hypothetical protein
MKGKSAVLPTGINVPPSEIQRFLYCDSVQWQ